MKEKNYFGNMCIDGKMILRWVFKNIFEDIAYMDLDKGRIKSWVLLNTINKTGLQIWLKYFILCGKLVSSQ
jgi:hypothetical protein